MESDSDSAPEDVTFKESKGTALSKLRDRAEVIKTKRLKAKEIRKRKHELYKEQKEKKLQRLEALEKKKIDPRILESLPEDIPDSSPPSPPQSQESSKVTTFPEDDDDDKEEKEESSEDFIALSTAKTDFKVVSRKDQEKMKTASSAALNFRKEMLNGPHIKRESANERLARMAKLKASGNNVYA